MCYLNLNSNCYNVNFNLKTYFFRLDEFAANVATIQDLMTELQKEDLTSEEYKDLQSKYQVSIQFSKQQTSTNIRVIVRWIIQTNHVK